MKASNKQDVEPLDGQKMVDSPPEIIQSKGREDWGRIILICIGTIIAVVVVVLF